MNPTPHRSDPDLVVLHALRCIGTAPCERLAAAVQLSQADVESELIDLARSGLVTYWRGGFGGWTITEAGRGTDDERIAAELDQTGSRELVGRSYDAFLVLNPELLEVCTAWQLRPVDGLPNDHADHRYDARVLQRLSSLHRRGQAICTDLAGVLERFSPYGSRLSRALERSTGGELGYVTDNTDSYHTVWFQLHEDLLVTLGTPRW
ncbi:MAG: transcriptional regulator [Propionicimonas sp.]|nr:transcriptional regulator [Propionicimonas sp.]